MKILVVSQYFWPESFRINELVDALSAKIDVAVLTGKPNYPDGRVFKGYSVLGVQREVKGRVEIVRVPLVPRGVGSPIRLIFNYLSFVVFGYLLGFRAMRNSSYDLVFVFAPSPVLQALPAIRLARHRKVPLVLWVQDLWPDSLSATGHVTNRWVLSSVARVVRYIYRSCDCILVQSPAFLKPVSSLCGDPDKIRYYPNLYATSPAIPGSEQANKLVKALEPYFNVVFAGNLGAAQALDTIVEAARLLLPYPQIRLVMVGSGSRDAWLQKQRDDHGVGNIVLAGRFEASDMATIFEASQALLVSLRSDPVFGLTIPSKVQAYLCSGRPIIAALDGEGARIIEEAGAGFCSAAGDAEALAGNVLRLYKMSPSERTEMGDRGLQYFDRHFSPQALVNELLEIFKEQVSRTERMV
jgi:glycosyltransferase involved in cell wall biosynthesis